ncbi:hypothetical protein AK88_00385 [Plasmodium fragile]|uniref:Uncharacterized protein n=1 Tax=Plasmodium fragile TaxID=5857 RepID=A0A0D9QS78_PLAFR|nr:uncharacterized protein AK88_00385 [Plasmodium fragile]KJP89929.1 hypothetical protein AK88_00385 [Plasmodium fragile]
MSGWLLNLLANTKILVDRVRVTFLFFSHLLLLNIPLKNVRVKNISFEFDFIKKIISFFTKKKKKKKTHKANKATSWGKKEIHVESLSCTLDWKANKATSWGKKEIHVESLSCTLEHKANKATSWGKKEIHVESLSCTLDWREYEEYNLHHNTYARLLHESLQQKIVHFIWNKLLRLFFEAIFKHYFLRVGKLCVHIRYRHAHTHEELCGGGDKCNTKRSTTYHLTLCDVCLFLDHYGGGTSIHVGVGDNPNGQVTPDKRKDHLSPHPPSHLRCRKIYLRKENEQANTFLVKNVFFFVKDRRLFVSLFYLNAQVCELKEVFYAWGKRQPRDHFVKDLIQVLQRNSLQHSSMWNFLHKKQASISPPLASSIASNVGVTFGAEFFSNFFFLLDTLIVKLHVGSDIEVRTTGRKLTFETPLGGADPYRCTHPWEMFSLSVESLLTWTEKNVICINGTQDDKLLCDVPLEDDLHKCRDTYNANDVEVVHCITSPLYTTTHAQNVLLREGCNRYRLSLYNSCVIIHLEELLTIQSRLISLFGAGLGLRGGHARDKFKGVIASPTEAVLMSLFHFTVYVNKKLNKSVLLKSTPNEKPREEELPYGMSTQQGTEGVLKLEVQKVTNHAVRDHPCESNQGGMFNTEQHEHVHVGSMCKGSPHFYLNKVILKWVYYKQGVLYEYAISDHMDITCKRERKQEGGRLSSVTMVYAAVSTWYLLPEHVIFVQDLYLLCCQHGRRKKRFPVRGTLMRRTLMTTTLMRRTLLRRNKKRRDDTTSTHTHSNSYIILTFKNCLVHLFCISRNFYIYRRVCKYIGHADMNLLKGVTKEGPPLSSISVTCNFLYLLNFASKEESSSKQSRTCGSHFYLSNVGVHVRELPNRLNQVCVFKRGTVPSQRVPSRRASSQRGKSEPLRQPNSRYDIVVCFRNKKVHVDMRNVARVTFCTFVMYELYAALLRMVNGVDWGGGVSRQPWGGDKSNRLLQVGMKGSRGRRRVYHFLPRRRSTTQMSESCFAEGSPTLCNYQDEEDKLTQGEAPKQPIPLPSKKRIKQIIQSRCNKRKLVKYQLQVDIKSQVAFLSADQVRSMHELQNITNDELRRSEYTLCLEGRLSFLYFDPLHREHIKRYNFLQLHLEAHKVKVRKRTHSKKNFQLFHFEQRRFSHQGSLPSPDVFSPSFYKLFLAPQRSRTLGGDAGRYFTVEATVRNVDEVMDSPTRGGRKYNSETLIRGRGLRMIYKTNDFFFFLNKYLLTDACYLFSVRRAMEEVMVNPVEGRSEECMHSESAYLHFCKAEVADPFILRNSIARKRQEGSHVDKTKQTHYLGYKVKRSELKTLPVSLNKYQLVLNKVILFLPSMTNNRNFLLAKNDVVVRNHIEVKKKKKKKKKN